MLESQNCQSSVSPDSIFFFFLVVCLLLGADDEGMRIVDRGFRQACRIMFSMPVLHVSPLDGRMEQEQGAAALNMQQGCLCSRQVCSASCKQKIGGCSNLLYFCHVFFLFT